MVRFDRNMISIIIPSYNSELTIERCLASLQNQTYGGQCEIILVDSSIDKTVQIVEDKFPQVRLFHFPTKTDPGTARNHGVKNSKGDLVLFIDSDCIAEPDWMEKMECYHREHPEVAAIGGSVVNGNHEDDLVGLVGYISEFREFLPQQPQGFVRSVPTLNISYKRWVFERHGFFDPHYYPQEDLVFNHNITSNGEKILFIPEIKVRHHHRSETSHYLRHQKNIGRITAMVLKTVPLPGSSLAKNKLLFVFMGPFLPIVKYMRTIKVFLTKNPGLLMRHPLAFVLLKVGLLYWYSGFFSGVFSKLPAREQEIRG